MEVYRCDTPLPSVKSPSGKLRALPKELQRNIGYRIELMCDDLQGDAHLKKTTLFRMLRPNFP
jgi:hypothetical protein